MRFRRRRVQMISLATKIVTKDKEGVPEVSYGTPVDFECEVWPASSDLQVKTYGERIKSIQNVKIKRRYTINSDQSITFTNGYTLREGDGVYLYEIGEEGYILSKDNEALKQYTDELIKYDAKMTFKPDYQVISIMPYKPLRLEIEKL